ncbi:MAG: alpha/beta fold hydrolase [Candidatus Riflebacteria bacterium]|nr:alpha/beta fold hydrolase [Candidatus Riflebacteria bacterium]
MSVRQEYVLVNGARLWTSTQGTGVPLVLCHGGPGLWDYLEPLAQMLEDVTTVHRYDQRGCGRSAAMPPYDVATMVGDLEALRRRWGHTEWILGGHSWGADLALTYALAYPSRVRGLIYTSGTGLDLDWREEHRLNQRARLTSTQQLELARLKARLTRARGADFEEADHTYCRLLWSTDFADRRRAFELAGRLVQAGRHPNYEVNRAILEDWRRIVQEGELRRRARQLSVPVLIVHGDADPRPSSIASRLAQQISGARLTIMPSVGHFPFIEAPESYSSTVKSFLRLVDPSTSAPAARPLPSSALPDGEDRAGDS